MKINASDLVLLETRKFPIHAASWQAWRAKRALNEAKGNSMTTKLTPRQNELVSEALVRYAAENFNSALSQNLKALREALVTELCEVSLLTATSPAAGAPRRTSR